MNKGIVEIGRDFFADFIGFERGVFYTLKLLLFDPYAVVEAYKQKEDLKICTPFSLIALMSGFFLIIANLIGLEERVFQFTTSFSKSIGYPFLAEIFSEIWTNLPILISLYIVIGCIVLSLFTRKLGLSFYDHLVANLYNLSVSFAVASLVILVFPLIHFDSVLMLLLVAAAVILVILLKKVKLRILFYYPEDCRLALKLPMMLSGLVMALFLYTPLFVLIYLGRL
jgi:hypothetical protein